MKFRKILLGFLGLTVLTSSLFAQTHDHPYFNPKKATSITPRVSGTYSLGSETYQFEAHLSTAEVQLIRSTPSAGQLFIDVYGVGVTTIVFRNPSGERCNIFTTGDLTVENFYVAIASGDAVVKDNLTAGNLTINTTAYVGQDLSLGGTVRGNTSALVDIQTSTSALKVGLDNLTLATQISTNSLQSQIYSVGISTGNILLATQISTNSLQVQLNNVGVSTTSLQSQLDSVVIATNSLQVQIYSVGVSTGNILLATQISTNSLQSQINSVGVSTGNILLATQVSTNSLQSQIYGVGISTGNILLATQISTNSLQVQLNSVAVSTTALSISTGSILLATQISTNSLQVQLNNVAIATTTIAYKVAVSSADSAPLYLNTKITGGPGVSILNEGDASIKIDVTAAPGAGTVFYLSTQTSSLGGTYRLMTSTYNFTLLRATDTVSTTASNIDLFISSYVTPATQPNVTFISAGIWEAHFCLRQTVGSRVCRPVAYIYKRDVAGVETLLGTSEIGDIVSAGETDIDVHISIPDTVLNATDRLMIVRKIRVTSGGTNPTIESYIQGDSAVRLIVPIFIPDTKHSHLTELDYASSGHTGFLRSDSVYSTSTICVVFGDTQTAAGNLTGFEVLIPIVKDITIKSFSIGSTLSGNCIVAVSSAQTAGAVFVDISTGTSLTSATDVTDSSLASWTLTSIPAGGYLKFYVKTAATVTQVVASIKYWWKIW